MAASVRPPRVGAGDARAHAGLLRVYLSHPSTAVRARIVDLIAYDENRASELLIEAITDPSPAVRVVAAARMNSLEYVPLLSETALSDPVPAVRANAVWRLANILYQRSPSVYLRALNDRSAKVRVEAAAALSRLPLASSAAAIRHRLSVERDRFVRISCYAALVQLGEPAWVDALTAELRSPVPVVRARAAEFLANAATAKTAASVIETLAAAAREEADTLAMGGICDAICALACVGNGVVPALERVVAERPGEEILRRTLGRARARSREPEAVTEPPNGTPAQRHRAGGAR